MHPILGLNFRFFWHFSKIEFMKTTVHCDVIIHIFVTDVHTFLPHIRRLIKVHC
jgi:hypothetical protein